MHLFFLSHVLYSTLIDWVIFKVDQILICLLEFHIAFSKILLTTCADQLLYHLSSIKLCSACAKQNAAVKIARDACSLLAK